MTITEFAKKAGALGYTEQEIDEKLDLISEDEKLGIVVDYSAYLMPKPTSYPTSFKS